MKDLLKEIKKVWDEVMEDEEENENEQEQKKEPSPDAEDEKEQEEEEEHSLVAEDDIVVSLVYVLNLGLWLAFLL